MTTRFFHPSNNQQVAKQRKTLTWSVLINPPIASTSHHIWTPPTWAKILMSKQGTQIHLSSRSTASTTILLTSNRKFLSNNKRLPCKTTRTTALCWETVQVSNNQRFYLQSVKEPMSNLNLGSKLRLTPKSILVLNKRYSGECKLKLHTTRATNSKEHLNLQILWIKVMKSTIVTGNSQLWFQTR